MWCGTYLGVSKITKISDGNIEINDIIPIQINFDSSAEIKDVKSTNNDFIYQIIAYNYDDAIQSVLTWDFEKEVEISLH